MSLAVKSKTTDLVKCEVIDGGELKSRRHLNVRGKSATLPSITGIILLFNYSLVDTLNMQTHLTILCSFAICFNITDKDWEDIKFGVDNQVDFYAVSFVKDARVVHELKDYLKSNFLPVLFLFYAYGSRCKHLCV